MSEDFWFCLESLEVTRRLLCYREYICVTECHMVNDATYDKNVNGDILYVKLPPNNAMESQAIQSALTTSIYLIYGPPGTGKTNTGTKLIYFFHQMNKLRQKDQGGDYSKILVCGPSNKSVDLSARRLLQHTNTEGPCIVRIHGASVEQTAFFMSGRVFSEKRGMDYKSDTDMNAKSVHHLIRKNKQYAKDILKYEENFKRNPFSIDSETMLRYRALIKAATIDEIKKHNVILCTTLMAFSPRLLDAIVNNIHQLMIAECGMCTEPECLSSIIATRPKPIILIGDHMQRRPIVMCKQAADLGLDKSLFERYSKTPVKFVQLRDQYRMHDLIWWLPPQRFYEGSLITTNSLPYEENPLLSIWINEEGMHREERHIFCHVEGHEEASKVSTEDQNENSFNNIEEINQVVKILRNLLYEDRLFANQNSKLIVNMMSQYNAQSNAITTALKKEKLEQYLHTVVSSQGRLLQHTNTERPCIVRIHRASVEQTAFFMSGRVFSEKRGMDYKPDTDMNAISVYHLIRKNKQYAKDILKYEENLKKNPASIDSETMLRYRTLIKAATIDKIKKHNDILCTTPMAFSPRLLDAIVNNIHQLMIAESGMCTEPECISSIIATRPKPIILIGDHMQRRPIVMCKQAADLGLDKSLFERYCKLPVKFVQLREQYRMVKILRHYADRLLANQNSKLIVNMMSQYNAQCNAMTTALKKEKLEQYVDVHTVVSIQECSSSTKKVQSNSGSFFVYKSPLLSATTPNRISKKIFEDRNFKEIVNSIIVTYAGVEFFSHKSNLIEFINEFRVRRNMHMTQPTRIFESRWFVEDEFLFSALITGYLKVKTKEHGGIVCSNADNIQNSDESFSNSFSHVSYTCVSLEDILPDFNLLHMLSTPNCYKEALSEISPHDLYKLIIKEFKDTNSFTYEHEMIDDFMKKENVTASELREMDDLERDFDSALCQKPLHLLRITMDKTEVIIQVYDAAYSSN